MTSDSSWLAQRGGTALHAQPTRLRICSSLIAPTPQFDGTVWYRFTAPLTGTLEIVMDSQPTTARRNFMPALAIHVASKREVRVCGADTQQSVALTAPVRAGESYLIAAMSNGFPGDYRIHWAVR